MSLCADAFLLYTLIFHDTLSTAYDDCIRILYGTPSVSTREFELSYSTKLHTLLFIYHRLYEIVAIGIAVK
jgi:hypothetical protein